MFSTDVYYNNFNLNTLQGVVVTTYNATDLPTRNLNTSKLARANRSLLTSAEYAEKTVTVSGYICGSDAAEQQDNFDRLKANVQEVEGIIRIVQGTKTVEYVGTLNAVTKNFRSPNLDFTLEFKCANPIGKDMVTMNLFSPVTITTATLSLPITVEGSFVAEPRFTIRVNSVTGGTTNKSISILNAATGKGIQLKRNWVAGDIISIASDTMEVTANTVIADFIGQFPTFVPGSRTLQYIDDFTTRNVTLLGVYNRRYS